MADPEVFTPAQQTQIDILMLMSDQDFARDWVRYLVGRPDESARKIFRSTALAEKSHAVASFVLADATAKEENPRSPAAKAEASRVRALAARELQALRPVVAKVATDRRATSNRARCEQLLGDARPDDLRFLMQATTGKGRMSGTRAVAALKARIIEGNPTRARDRANAVLGKYYRADQRLVTAWIREGLSEEEALARLAKAHQEQAGQ